MAFDMERADLARSNRRMKSIGLQSPALPEDQPDCITIYFTGSPDKSRR